MTQSPSSPENKLNPKSSEIVARQILWMAHERGKFLTPMQLLKLVYISHGWMLALYDRSLFYEPVEAWKYGPVEPTIYHKFKKFGNNQITEPVKDHSDHFDDYELDIMNQVLDAYGDFTGLELSGLTHQPDSPWAETIKILGINAAISNDLIKMHYLKIWKSNPNNV